MREGLVRPYRAGDAAAFKALNVAWITRYFALEPTDLEVLDHPERILADGGAIFIAERADAAIGVCALLTHGEGTLKLEKMAVAEAERGKGVGAALLQAAIDHAAKAGARRVYLESGTKLTPAIALYEKFGFRHIPPEEREASPYARADVFMELALS